MFGGGVSEFDFKGIELKRPLVGERMLVQSVCVRLDKHA